MCFIGSEYDVTTFDFITGNINFSYNWIITNPPWSRNLMFFNRLVSLKKSFAILVKIEILGNKYFKEAINNASCFISVVPIIPKPKFLNENTQKQAQVGNCVWVIDHFTTKFSKL